MENFSWNDWFTERGFGNDYNRLKEEDVSNAVSLVVENGCWSTPMFEGLFFDKNIITATEWSATTIYAIANIELSAKFENLFIGPVLYLVARPPPMIAPLYNILYCPMYINNEDYTLWNILCETQPQRFRTFNSFTYLRFMLLSDL